MLRVVTGPFHPSLQASLVSDLQQLKSQDPGAPVAIVVPSDHLRRHLKRVLCLDHGCALSAVYIFTFHQLALHLSQEYQQRTGGSGRRVELVSDLFFEQLLQQLGHRKLPYREALSLTSLPRGVWAALWATVRDIKNAMVDPSVVIRAVEAAAVGELQEHLEADEIGKLNGLFTLYAALQESSKILEVGSPDDLASAVAELVPSSDFLRGLTALYYYGSYDLTQVQLSLLEALIRHVPVSLYFPLDSGPEFIFAQRFFDRHVQLLRGTMDPPAHAVAEEKPKDRRQAPLTRMLNTAGQDDELICVCKEILSLVETNGYAFHEIGVVARSLMVYQEGLRRIFDQHRIPFVSNSTLPVLREPVAKTLLQLAEILAAGFTRSAVLDLLSSPYYRLRREDTGHIEARPDQWRVAAHALGIVREEQDWQRLARVAKVDAWGSNPDEEDGGGREEPALLSVETAQLRLFWRAVSGLCDDCRSLPLEGAYDELTAAFLSLAARQMEIPGLSLPSLEIDPDTTQDATHDALAQAFLHMSQLGRLGQSVGWEEWTTTFTQVLERSTYEIAPFTNRGVQVLDAMAARGIDFRALFVIGLNEKVFPRFIHEDAFLRDRHRRFLSQTLGYKLDEKLQGYDEETLLFRLLEQAAQQRLYLSYQRADTDGRPLAASALLDRSRHGRSGEIPDEVVVPRRWSDRLALPQFSPLWLTREELATVTILQTRDPAEVLLSRGQNPLLFKNGREALLEMERETGGSGFYDGVVGPSATRWRALERRGVSPTSLEAYARCPFQYFVSHMLRLKSVRELPQLVLPPQALGHLSHAALKTVYERLMQDGWPGQTLLPGMFEDHIATGVAESFASYSETHGTGYHLLWQLAQDTVRKLVTAVVTLDEQDYLQEGFIPTAFEVEAEGTLGEPETGRFADLRIHGRLDRVDRHSATRRVRVIDYKYRDAPDLKADDRNLVQAALRGKRLQPALYACMALTGSGQSGSEDRPERVDFVFLVPHGDPIVERASFDQTVWTSPSGKPLTDTIRSLLDGIRSGRHVILPDSYCAYCEYAVSCRSRHHPTWWRAHRDADSKLLRLLRKQKEPV